MGMHLPAALFRVLRGALPANAPGTVQPLPRPGEPRRALLVSIKRISLGFLAAALAVVILTLPLPLLGAAPAERLLRIEASQFQFSPSEITLNPGDRVTVELVSMDVVHGLSLDGYDFELTADPGQTAVGTFVASQAGVFRFRCLIPCGNLHPFMIGKLQVGASTLFWRAIALGALAAVAGLWSVRT